jgi:hypothetical protein
MIFEGARDHDMTTPLHSDRLELGMLDIQMRQRIAWPERAMRRISRSFWVAFWLLLGFAVTATIWVHP